MKKIYILTINLNTLKIKHLNKVSAPLFGVLSNTFSKEKQRAMNYGCLEIGKAFKCHLKENKRVHILYLNSKSMIQKTITYFLCSDIIIY